jgi:hypothetical protein
MNDPGGTARFRRTTAGKQSFRLQNVRERRVATHGSKVQAKGVLIRQYMNDRINVTSLDTIAPTCP